MRVSVIVASRGRPALLPRCLTGLSQVCHEAFEVIVVTDPAGLDALRAAGWDERVKRVPFDEPNLSAARNAGLAVAAGEVVAFIDDDAVPEPTWLAHLTAPFEDEAVWATGGYVIGRNGISFQYAARATDAGGFAQEIDAPSEAAFEPVLPPGLVAKTEGTNCAFRRTALAGIGGFDPAFRYFLDETDVDRRLAAAGGRSVLVPLARVHHGYAASDRRAPDRAPTSLGEIGASAAVFWRKHAGGLDRAALARRLISQQRAALIRHMVAGNTEPRDVDRLIATLKAGMDEGEGRALGPLPPLPAATAPFLPMPAGPARHRTLSGRSWNRAALRRAAGAAIAAGEAATVIRLSPTALPHRVQFTSGGWWEQRGGLFGRARRNEPWFRFWSFRKRVAHEWDRVRALRVCGQS